MTRLLWGIKRSLLEYVTGLIDGRVVTTDGAGTDGSQFVFPGATTADATALRFCGAVVIAGHGGLLELPVRDPELRESETGWELTIADPDQPGTRLRFATIGELAADGGDSVRGRHVRMTSDGAALVWGPYEAGTGLDDLIVMAGSRARAEHFVAGNRKTRPPLHA